MNLQITICTTDRNPNFVYEQLASIGFGDKKIYDLPLVQLVVCGYKTQYLDNLKHLKNLKIIELEEGEYERLKNWNPRQKASYNYWRCLYLGRELDFPQLVVEDDVIFSSSWYNKVEDAYNVAAHEYGNEFILRLWSFVRMENTTRIYRLPLLKNYGTQAVLWTVGVRRRFQEYLLSVVWNGSNKTYDMIMLDFASWNNIPVLTLSQEIKIFKNVGLNNSSLEDDRECTTDKLGEVIDW